MDRYQKILHEICYIIRIRKEWYEVLCKERKSFENMHSRIMYDELNKMIEFLFMNAEKEEKESIWSKNNESTS